MSSRRWMMAAAILGMSLALGACATKTNDGEEQVTSVDTTKEDEDTKQTNLDMLEPAAYGNVEGLNLEPGTYLSVIGRSEGGEFWEAVQEGAQQAVTDINAMMEYEGDDQVKMVYSGPSTTDDVDDQVNILDEELARYPSALGIAIIDTQSCEVQFDLATENNIPIVTFDSASDYQGIMAKIATNNTQAATTVAVNMAEQMEESGEVMIFVNDSKSTTSKSRVDGFVQEMQTNHTGITVGNTYYMDNLDELKKQLVEEVAAGTYSQDTGAIQEAAPEEATNPTTEGTQNTTDATGQDANGQEEISIDSITDDDVLTYIIAKNPNVTGIYATNDAMVTKAVEAYDQMEKEDLVVIGFDAGEDQQEALKDGKVQGLVVQNPYGMGYATIVAEARSILELGNEADIDSGYTWVTADNIDKKSIQKILY